MQFVLIILCAIQNIGTGFVYIVASYFLLRWIAEFLHLYDPNYFVGFSILHTILMIVLIVLTLLMNIGIERKFTAKFPVCFALDKHNLMPCVLS
jgi:hypothetical protein